MDLGDLDFPEHLYHPCFQGNQLNLRVLEVPWDQGDHLHLCYHWDLVVPVFHGLLHCPCFLVALWVLQVHDYRVIPQHLLVPRNQDFLGCLEFPVHRNTHHDHRIHMMRSFEECSKGMLKGKRHYCRVRAISFASFSLVGSKFNLIQSLRHFRNCRCKKTTRLFFCFCVTPRH